MSVCIQWPFTSNINRLTKWGTSTRDTFNFHAKLLDWAGNQWHHVASVRIQHKQWNNIPWCCYNEWFENFFNPFKHCTLIHPCILPTRVLTARWKSWKLFCSNPTILFTFEINIGGNFVPSAHIITARVAHLVSFVEIQMMTDFFASHLLSCLEQEVKMTWIWSILIMYFFKICLTYFFLMKLNASDAASTGECWCAFNHLYTINNFSLSDLKQKMWHKLVLLLTQFGLSLPFPAQAAKTHT